ncbi:MULTISPECIES: hypothetical protein [Actinosynnema]|uniref:hypothetical protein n=1 Tax=Actinosynnema TaxID=40566 RepID=UPI0020A26367|nr:hypothetical protein [Actinosynnema pretiosum]MCP2096528.1 hypothetical protein [Actinosynnema pretiosum]
MYAFGTADRFGVAVGKTVLRAEGPYDGGPIAWTLDGRHAFATTGGRVTVVSAREGAGKTVECRCERAVPLGQHGIAWVTGDELRVLDPDSSAETAVPLPPELRGRSGTDRLLAGSEELVYGYRAGETPVLYALDGAGAYRELPAPGGEVLSVRPGPAWLTAAVVVREAGATPAGCGDEHVAMLTTTVGELAEVAVDSPGPHVVRDVWWDGAELEASIGPGRCEGDGLELRSAEAALHSVRDGRWEAMTVAGGGGLLVRRDFSDDGAVALGHAGELLHVEGRVREVVFFDVERLELAPR